MARRTKTLTVSLPPDWYEELESIARKEHKSKSQLFREMMLAHKESALRVDGGSPGGRPPESGPADRQSPNTSAYGGIGGAAFVTEDGVTGLVAPVTLSRLATRARVHGRSVEEEIKAILEEATGGDMARAREAARRAQERTKGRIRGDSADLIAKDRRR